jgi:NAD(P)-dependent dehydrogenase (short-subunit alcohol dehydrogenase family)
VVEDCAAEGVGGFTLLLETRADWFMRNARRFERALEVARGNIALRKFGTAADIAELVCFLASDRAGFISGQMIDVDGGYGV